MANVTESSTWAAGIYQLELTDPVAGGPTGLANRQARELGDRTRWLRDRAVLDNEPKTISALHTFSAGLVTGLVHRGTLDGNDNASLALSGGGAADANRGAYLVLNGNQTAAEAGHIKYVAGSKGRHRFSTNDGAGATLEKLVIAHGTIQTHGGITNTQAAPSIGGGFMTRAATFSTDGTYGALYCPGNNTVSLEVGNSISYGTCQLMPNGGHISMGAVPTIAGSSPGEPVIGNGKALRAVNAAGTSTVPLISLNASNQVALSQPFYTDHNVTIHGSLRMATSVVAGANAGDIVMANGMAVRGVNAAGTGVMGMISVGASNEVRLGSNAGPVVLGAVGAGSLTGANTGDLVLANGAQLRWANAAGTAAIPTMHTDSANNVRLGWSPGAAVFLNTFHSVVDPGQTSWSSHVNWGNAAGLRRILCSNAPPAGAHYLYFMP